MKKPKPSRAMAEAPAEYDDTITRALKALQTGTASPDQQQQALNWIIHEAARTYDQPFRPGGDDGARATDFACGRMFVGQQIVKQLNRVMPTRRI